MAEKDIVQLCYLFTSKHRNIRVKRQKKYPRDGDRKTAFYLVLENRKQKLFSCAALNCFIILTNPSCHWILLVILQISLALLVPNSFQLFLYFIAPWANCKRNHRLFPMQFSYSWKITRSVLCSGKEICQQAIYTDQPIQLAFKSHDSIIQRHTCTFSKEGEPISSVGQVELLTPTYSLWQGWALLLLSLGRIQQGNRSRGEKNIKAWRLFKQRHGPSLCWFAQAKCKHPAVLFSGLCSFFTYWAGLFPIECVFLVTWPSALFPTFSIVENSTILPFLNQEKMGAFFPMMVSGGFSNSTQ